MEILEDFINQLVQNEELIASEVVLRFLSQTGQKDHSKVLKSDKEKAKPPTSIHDL